MRWACFAISATAARYSSMVVRIVLEPVRSSLVFIRLPDPVPARVVAGLPPLGLRAPCPGMTDAAASARHYGDAANVTGANPRALPTASRFGSWEGHRSREKRPLGRAADRATAGWRPQMSR